MSLFSEYQWLIECNSCKWGMDRGKSVPCPCPLPCPCPTGMSTGSGSKSRGKPNNASARSVVPKEGVVRGVITRTRSNTGVKLLTGDEINNGRKRKLVTFVQALVIYSNSLKVVPRNKLLTQRQCAELVSDGTCSLAKFQMWAFSFLVYLHCITGSHADTG